METLWNTVIKNPKETIQKYFKPICIELDKSLQHSNWRYRVVQLSIISIYIIQASCLGIMDIIQGKVIDDIEFILHDFLLHITRCMDDVKDEGRDAANTAVYIYI